MAAKEVRQSKDCHYKVNFLDDTAGDGSQQSTDSEAMMICTVQQSPAGLCAESPERPAPCSLSVTGSQA